MDEVHQTRASDCPAFISCPLHVSSFALSVLARVENVHPGELAQVVSHFPSGPQENTDLESGHL